ncbi:MAG: ubiquinone/menaquinone biosynthesis methyltransferase [Thermoplasmata archaeon]|nr:ubiquinone/menaquinone biosynthesis methyltransferase [Thermoplasmata archaeon]
MASTPSAERVASDGSPYPDRSRPSFEHDVRAMFTHIAVRYDWFDHLASVGNDFLWRPRALWDLDRFHAGAPRRRILDIGCGTGDLTVLASRRFPQAEVVGADFTAAMVERAEARTVRDANRPRVRYARASAMHLPFRSGSFDIAMSAFVARNLPSLPDAFHELRRVLAPTGTLLTLEITEPPSPLVGGLFHAHFDRVVPWLGAAVHSAGPYRYLPESLKFLPKHDEMLALLHRVGFDRVISRRQSMGIVTAYLAGAAAPGPAPRHR